MNIHVIDVFFPLDFVHISFERTLHRLKNMPCASIHQYLTEHLDLLDRFINQDEQRLNLSIYRTQNWVEQ